MVKINHEQVVRASRYYATNIVRASGIETRSDRRAIVLGSNYLVFEKNKADPDCIKCTDTPKIAQPTKADEVTFEISLEIWKLLREMEIETTVAILPSDFMKGADNQELKRIRKRYQIPEVFQQMMDRYQVPLQERFFALESSFKRRALSLLKRRIMNNIATREIETNDRTTIMGMVDSIPIGLGASYVPVEVPVARKIELEGGRTMSIPLCQTILSTAYRELTLTGFTDFFGIVRADEKVCVNQGTKLANEIAVLGMNATITSFETREKDGLLNIRITGLDKYMPKK